MTVQSLATMLFDDRYSDLKLAQKHGTATVSKRRTLHSLKNSELDNHELQNDDPTTASRTPSTQSRSSIIAGNTRVAIPQNGQLLQKRHRRAG